MGLVAYMLTFLAVVPRSKRKRDFYQWRLTHPPMGGATSTLFYVGGTGNLATAANWSSTSGGAGGAGTPTASTDLVLDANSGTGTVTMNSAIACNSFNASASSVKTFTVTTAGAMTIGSATAGLSSVALEWSGFTTVTVAQTGTSHSFVSTSATAQNVNFAGKTVSGSGVTFNGVGGSWKLTGAMTTGSGTGVFSLSQGSLNTNAQAVTAGSFSSNVALTRSLTLGTSTITVLNGGVAWNAPTTTGLTLSAASATIVLSGPAAVMSHASTTGSAGTFGTVNITGSGAAGLNISGGTIATFNRTGTAVTTDSLAISGAPVVSSSLTFAGNSITNRLQVFSNSIGSSRGFHFTGSTQLVSNVDFMDYAGSGTTLAGASLGDCGNNTGVTFTAAVTRFAVVAGNWSSTATWSSTSGGAGGSTVPLPQDTVNFNASSAAGTYTVDLPRMCKDLNCTGFTRTLSFNSASGQTIFGNVTLSSGGTFSFPHTTILGGRGSQTLTSAGKQVGQIQLAAPGGTYTQQDNLTLGSNILTHSEGTWADGGFTFGAASFASTSGVARAVTASGVWTLTGTTPITFTTVALTLSMAASTIIVNSSSACTFAGGGGTFGNLWQSGAGTLTVTGANSFQEILINANRTLTLPASTTTSITAINSFGNAGNLAVLNSSLSGTQATLSIPAGKTIAGDFLSIKDVAIAPGAGRAFSGLNSTLSNSPGWLPGPPSYATLDAS